MSEPDLPRAPEAEKLALGCIISFPDCAAGVFQKLHTRDFTDAAHRAIYGAMLNQHAQGLLVDPPLIARELEGHREFADGNPAGRLLELGEAVATVANIDHYCDQILEARRKRQLLQIAQTAAESAQNGHTADDVYRLLTADLDDFRRDAMALDQQPENKFTFADLQRQYPRLNPPVIDGLVRQAETVNIIANSKAGKSWLAYNILLCTITGRPLFNHFATSPGRCLLIDNELHKPTLASRIPAVASALQIHPREYENDLDIWTLRGNLTTLAELASELEQIKPEAYRVILFDAKYRFLSPGVSENDNAAETQLYNLLDRIAEQTQAALLLVHHGSKGQQSDKRVTDVGAGAGAQSRAADCHIVLREHEEPGIVIMEAAVRSFAPVEPLALQWQFPLWVPVAGVDCGKLKGRQSAKQQRQTEQDQADCQKLIKIVGGIEPTTATAREIGRKSGISHSRQKRLLDLLESRGDLTAQQATIKGNECRVYSIVQATK